MKILTNKILIVSALTLSVLVFGNQANGQVEQVAGKAAEMGTVPVNTSRDSNTTALWSKAYIKDRLATIVAKQLLHQMTADIVDWINSGYEGNPAFLNNPTGFFMDVADQTTGEFIGQSGVLSQLCGPFNLQLRLNIALGANDFRRKRYSCTLSTIVNNAANAQVGASVGASQNGATLGDMIDGRIVNDPNQLNVNGRSIDATGEFLSGDFGVGGWKAFTALVTQPQNNYYGAYFSARNDLDNEIAEKNSRLNDDLNRGSGFLSWSDCKTLTRVKGPEAIADADTMYAGNTTLRRKNNADGSVTYQSCVQQTPGSAAAGMLGKSMQSKMTELELADNMNAIVSAALNQFISGILSKGLGTFSAGGQSSSNRVLLAQEMELYRQATADTQVIVNNDINSRTEGYNQYRTYISNGLTRTEQASSTLIGAKTCLTRKMAQPGNSSGKIGAFGNNEIADIDAYIVSPITPLLAELNRRWNESQIIADKLNKTKTSANGSAAYDEAWQLSQRIENDAPTLNAEGRKLLADANNALERANQFKAICEGFPENATFITR